MKSFTSTTMVTFFLIRKAQLRFSVTEIRNKRRETPWPEINNKRRESPWPEINNKRRESPWPVLLYRQRPPPPSLHEHHHNWVYLSLMTWPEISCGWYLEYSTFKFLSESAVLTVNTLKWVDIGVYIYTVIRQ